MINILILGGGGRESALAENLRKSSQTRHLFMAPGNAGCFEGVERVSLCLENFAAIKDFVIEKQIGMLVIGPEQPLVDGIRDYFMADANFGDLVIVGPGSSGARLEGSKDFAKVFMQKYGIPTARYQSFTVSTLEEGKAFLRSLPPPYVIKADGLASGKGVVILPHLLEAEEALEEMLCNSKFGKASERVVIEEFLRGVELSVFIVTDGKDYCMLPEAKDYKRIGEGDQGPNTGGMGSVSPVSFFTEELQHKVEEKIIEPTLRGLREERIPYAGFLFIGLMIIEGEPYVIEYNVRMGDPETQSVMKRIESDLVELFEALHTHTLGSYVLKISPQSAVTVVLATEHYPQAPVLGDEISLPGSLAGLQSEDLSIFYAGTRLEKGKIWTNGGRVMSVTALGNSMEEARNKAYQAEAQIQWRGKYVRKDIGMIREEKKCK